MTWKRAGCSRRTMVKKRLVFVFLPAVTRPSPCRAGGELLPVVRGFLGSESAVGEGRTGRAPLAVV